MIKTSGLRRAIRKFFYGDINNKIGIENNTPSLNIIKNKSKTIVYVTTCQKK